MVKGYDEKLELLEGGRVVATLYPRRRVLWLWHDCEGVRQLLAHAYLNVHLVPERECNTVYALDNYGIGRIMRYMKGKA